MRERVISIRNLQQMEANRPQQIKNNQTTSNTTQLQVGARRNEAIESRRERINEHNYN